MSNAYTLSATLPSSTISALAYQEAGGALVLTFTSGLAYLYTGVARALAGGLVAAESAGKFYNEHIRGKFPCTRVGNTSGAAER